MEIVTLCPLPATSLVWERAPDRFAITVVCKATVALEPVTSALAAEQEPILEREAFWDDDPKRSVFAPSDLVPFKPRADVVLVGSAYARNDVPVRSVVARLVVGEVDKSVEVFGPRVRTRDGDLREGKRWTKMPLLYERAAGGPGTDNPVGVRPDGPRDLYGQVQLPNLQPVDSGGGGPHTPGAAPSAPPSPIGFGPIAASWSERLRHAPHADHDAIHAPFGEGFDPAFFQVAPRDQQIDAIPPGERVTLENLHPKHPRLVTSLPDLQPRALVEIEGAPPREILLVADTLWIDTHRALCTLTYRGDVDVEGPHPEGRILVAATRADQEPSWPALAPSRPSRRAEPQVEEAPPPPPPLEDPLPPSREMSVSDLDSWDITQTDVLSGGVELEIHTTASALPALLNEPALPFQPPPPGWKPPASLSFGPSPSPLYDPRLTRISTQKLDMTGFRAGLPAWLDARPQVPPPPPPPSTPSTLASSAPRVPRSADLAAPFGVPAVPSVVSFGPPPPPSQPSLPIPDRPVYDGGTPYPGPVGGVPLGLLEASNAAASTTDRPSALPPDPVLPGKHAEVVEVLWFDPTLPARLRRHPVLAPLLRPDAAKAPDAPAADDLARAQVHDALTRAAPSIGAELEEALEAADEESPPVTPLALVSGELELCFDETEVLRAVVAAASPLAAGDKKLKDAVDLAVSMLEAPLQGVPEVAEALGARIREAWAKANRILPQGYIAVSTERMLLEQRRYQVREILDDRWIRALIAVVGQKAPVPTYLPSAIAKRLPLFRRFHARLLVEVLAQQDESETHPLALRALALGRIRMRRGAKDGR